MEVADPAEGEEWADEVVVEASDVELADATEARFTSPGREGVEYCDSVLGLDPEEAVDETVEFVLDLGMLVEGAEIEVGRLVRTLAIELLATEDVVDSALALVRAFWVTEAEDPDRLRD